MTLKEKLNQYMEKLGCTTKELAKASGLSASVISRYHSGERTPGIESDQLKKLAYGLAELSAQKNMPDSQYDKILSELTNALTADFNADFFSYNINYIITELNINVSALAKALNYDASFLSRIRTGDRMPSDVYTFTNRFAHYIVNNYSSFDVCSAIQKQLEPGGDEMPDKENLIMELERFLITSDEKMPDYASDFLHKLDEFDLNEYIRAIHFDKLRVSSKSFSVPVTKNYFGTEGQKKGELDFLKGTVLSKSKESVFMCSDMDMADIAGDLEFSKKWMVGLAMLLKKNRTIHIVHNLNRPFGELMLGLEAWIPLYMTGQVVPFYLKGTHNGFYQHLLYFSGTYALTGECIKEFHEQGRYILTNNKEELKYYRARARSILKKAYSLMDIYTFNQRKQFYSFYRSALSEEGRRHNICSSLPVFMLPDDLLVEVLTRNNFSHKDITILHNKIKRHRKLIQKQLETNSLFLEIPDYNRDEFEKYPLVLDFTEYECDKPVGYFYEDYRRHIKAIEEYAALWSNFTVKLCKDFAFRNMNIHILEGKWVWISKINAPVIHFVIHYPMLREAIENMYVPVYE